MSYFLSTGFKNIFIFL